MAYDTALSPTGGLGEHPVTSDGARRDPGYLPLGLPAPGRPGRGGVVCDEGQTPLPSPSQLGPQLEIIPL